MPRTSGGLPRLPRAGGGGTVRNSCRAAAIGRVPHAGSPPPATQRARSLTADPHAARAPALTGTASVDSRRGQLVPCRKI
jgi:hypothetical protein